MADEEGRKWEDDSLGPSHLREGGCGAQDATRQNMDGIRPAYPCSVDADRHEDEHASPARHDEHTRIDKGSCRMVPLQGESSGSSTVSVSNECTAITCISSGHASDGDTTALRVVAMSHSSAAIVIEANADDVQMETMARIQQAIAILSYEDDARVLDVEQEDDEYDIDDEVGHW
eukprot:CAMPEP_0167782422 /NCGR_PEP_ID=MMETSP0111_2-20121227/6508_1 /TAXON_ID=91324 /ORGANISM="Lotharella globosa, Strain CCCM811" /LENGTH=174 /DNA_ID=CAMNT_0007673251 /DNA_START=242 /DNA_END=763 /DNA_ORIENTATION=+